MTKQRNHLGFTLIELMITVAIVGILAAIALPAYKNYVIRSKLVAGTNSLSSLRAQMEQYYLDNRTYATVSSPSIVTPCVQNATSASKSNLFNVGCLATPTSAAYILTAQGTGVVANTEYRIDNFGTMSTVSLPTGWGTPASGNTCWIMRKGDTC